MSRKDRLSVRAASAESQLVLPSADELWQRLIAIDDRPLLQHILHSALVKFAGSTQAPIGIPLIVLTCLREYRLLVPNTSYEREDDLIPLLIEALSPSPEVATQNTNYWRGILNALAT